MLGVLKTEFDHADFLRKLRHYFMDTSPIEVDLTIKANSVLIKALASGEEVEYLLQNEKSVKDNIHDLAVLCEQTIYPILAEEKWVNRKLSLEERKLFLIQGFTLEDIHRQTQVKEVKTFYLARISVPSMTMVIKSEDLQQTFLAQFKKPLNLVMKEFLALAPSARFSYIETHGELKEITNEVR